MKIPDFLSAELIHIVGPDLRHLIEYDAELATVGVRHRRELVANDRSV